jgi:hypothetical protein
LLPVRWGVLCLQSGGQLFGVQAGAVPIVERWDIDMRLQGGLRAEHHEWTVHGMSGELPGVCFGLQQQVRLLQRQQFQGVYIGDPAVRLQGRLLQQWGQPPLPPLLLQLRHLLSHPQQLHRVSLRQPSPLQRHPRHLPLRSAFLRLHCCVPL